MRDLVAYARTHSAYFADLYRDVPEVVTDVAQLPVVTKAEMMRHFDQWVTDPSVNLEQVEAFVADPSLIGHDYLNRYVVCTTSGSTGTPAILLHDRGALVIYNVLGYVRALPVAMFSARNLWALVRGRGRLAAVFVTGGHFLGNTMMARRLRTVPSRARMQRLFSALSPVPELVADLNAFQPVVLGGYPSALQALATEQQAGEAADSSGSGQCGRRNAHCCGTPADRSDLRLSSGQLLRIVGSCRFDIRMRRRTAARQQRLVHPRTCR